MKLKEAIEQWDREKENWPGNISWKSKAKFEGISFGDMTITPEMLESKIWSITIRPMDHETINSIKQLFEKLNSERE